jgi:hypothetical protein
VFRGREVEDRKEEVWGSGAVPGGVSGLRELSEGNLCRSGSCDKSESRMRGVSVRIESMGGREAEGQ